MRSSGPAPAAQAPRSPEPTEASSDEADLSGGTGSSPAAAAPPPDARGDAALEAAIAEITPDLLRAHVEFLADDRLRGRATPSDGLDQAATYIAQTFAALGLQSPAQLQDFRQSFPCGRAPGELSSNVIGVLPGRDEVLGQQAVMVSAHYDHLGERAAESDEDAIYNGANDNATGVAGVLAIAASLRSLPTPLRRSVVFVAFCGEELGLRGSRHYVQEPTIPLERISAVVNLEMLGRPGDGPTLDLWITGAEYSNLIARMNEAWQPEGVRFISAREVGPVEGNAFTRSDNLPLARAGVVAHSVSVGRLDALYHHVDDEPDGIEFDRMAIAVRGLARAVVHLAQTDASPAWTRAGQAAGYGRREE